MNYSLQISTGAFHCAMTSCILSFVENFNDVPVPQCGYYFHGKPIKLKPTKIKFFFHKGNIQGLKKVKISKVYNKWNNYGS